MSRPRVLVVDDSKLDLAMARDYLEDSGFSVDTAASAEEALELIESTEYSLIITDQVMPGMNGTQLAQEIKKRKPNGPKVLLITVQDKVVSTNVASTLHKPFTKASLNMAAGMLCKAPAGAPRKAAAPSSAPAPSSFRQSSQARRPEPPKKKSWIGKLFG